MTSQATASKLQKIFLSPLYQKKLLKVLQYGVAPLSVAAALSITLFSYPLLQTTPAALFYVAVMVSSWAGGFGPGLFASMLSVIALNYFFLEPRNSLNITSLQAAVPLGVFAIAAILISSLNASRLAAKQRADANFRAWREREAQFAHLAEANIIGIFSATLQGTITEANDAFLKTLGYTREDLLSGRIRWDAITPPEDQQRSEQSQQELSATGVWVPSEQEYVCKDGSRVSVLLGLVMQDDQSMTGFVIDRSEFKRNEAERQQAEAALRESEERLRLAMEGAQMATWDVDLTTGKALWSDQHFIMLGYEPTPTGEASEASWYDRVHPEDRDRVALEWQQSRQEQRLYRAEYRVIRADTGQIAWLSAIGSFIYSRGGAAIRSIGVLFDITERKQDEEALRRSEERLRISQELSLDAFTILESVRDKTGRIVDFIWTYVNPKAAEILCHSVEELVGQRLLKVLPGNQTNSELFERYVRVVETGEPHDIELSYCADGITGWFRNMAVKLNDGVSIFFSDITDRKRTEQALRDAEERLRVALKNAPITVFNQDRDLKYTWFHNPVLYELNDMLGKHDRDYLPPKDAEPLTAIKQQVIRTGVGTRQEVRITRNGREHYYDLVVEPLRDETNTIVGITCAAIDISELKQTEIVLHERKQRLDLATSAANLGVFEWNVQTDFAVWENLRMYEIFGRTPAEGTINKTEFVGSVIHPDDREAFEHCLADGLKQGSFHTICRIRRRDEEWRWIEFNGQFEFAPEGVPLRLVGVVGDITERKRVEAERKQAEDDLRIAEERLRLALSAAHMMVWDWDLQANRVVCSDNSEEVWGVQIGTAEDFTAAIHPDDRAIVAQAATEAQQREGIFKCEYRVIRPDKKVRWLHSRGRAHFDAGGQAERMIGVTLDVSERVQIETERDALLRQEQVARQEAERANRIKDEFLAVLSHELRSPLNPILGWTKLLQSQSFSPEKTAQALATIERNAKLQSQLIEDLLDVSRILQGKMVLNPGSVNLITTVEAAIETVRLAAEAKSIQIHTHLDPQGGSVVGDAARLQQIVWNLLTNAIKFTPRGGRVDVKLNSDRGFAQIQVQDTGKGISPEFLPHVFDYFRQEDGATTRKFGGLGLGLALVRQLTEQHGGTVKAESAGEGQGATFTIRLPLQTLSPETDREEATLTQTPDLQDLKILIVDDEADMRDLVLTILEAEGAQVRTASSASEALTLLEQWQPELLISDIGMPEMDGYMLLRELRRRETLKTNSQTQAQTNSQSIDSRKFLPAIALTAYASEYDQQAAIRAGFQQHLAKPVEPEALIQSIASLATTKSHSPTPTQ